jgi:hypothetical protein
MNNPPDVELIDPHLVSGNPDIEIETPEYIFESPDCSASPDKISEL